MRTYNDVAKEYLRRFIRPMRKKLKLTQEKMAEAMRMASRSLGAAERGEDGVSATTLLFFLSLLPDADILRIVRGFPEEVRQREETEGQRRV